MINYNEDTIYGSGKILHTFYPGRKFPSISITGKTCYLNCSHCNGHYLEHMIQVNSPDMLKRVCMQLHEDKATGALISGGCDEKGQVMLDQYLKVIKEIKDKTNLILNIHTGIISETNALKLAKTGVDVVSFDIIGHEDTIKKVYGLDHKPEDYLQSLRALKDNGLKTIIPHICIGLHFGKIKGEYEAIQLASVIDPIAIVIIVLIPTKDTKMANIIPPRIYEIINIIQYIKSKLKYARIYLGCMRPKDMRFRDYNMELERKVIEEGINGIVLPSKTTNQWLKTQNKRFRIIEHRHCCAIF